MADVPDIVLYADDLGDDFHGEGDEQIGDGVAVLQMCSLISRQEPPPREESILQPINGIVQPPVVPPPNRPGRSTNKLEYIQKKIMTALLKHKLAWPFRKPVDAKTLGLPEYFEIIKYPMDLGTINQRLKNNYYWSAIECVKDLKTVFANCYQYNDPKEDVVSMAQTLDKIFMEKLRESPKEEIEINKFQKAPNRGRPPRYIIQDGAVINDRIIDGFKQQQQAAGGERI